MLQNRKRVEVKRSSHDLRGRLLLVQAIKLKLGEFYVQRVKH